MTPKPIRPDRLQELLPNLLAGTLTKDERDEVVLGHWRLANSIASKRAKRRPELADDLYGEARVALVEAVGAYKGDRSFDQFIIRYVGGVLDQMVKERIPEDSVGSGIECFGREDVVEAEVIEEASEISMDKDICRLRLEGYKDREIAERLNCSLSYVQKRRKAMERRHEQRNQVQHHPQPDRAVG